MTSNTSLYMTPEALLSFNMDLTRVEIFESPESYPIRFGLLLDVKNSVNKSDFKVVCYNEEYKIYNKHDFCIIGYFISSNEYLEYILISQLRSITDTSIDKIKKYLDNEEEYFYFKRA